ncbi:MAG: GGDEF domain-containing protein [Synergistaceae bacterium]|jgi:diguanylate cyclase (GGDEF)-like protein|nr:GGDEF domain-containing protein [Synergistaceae bacterium]
METLLRKKDSIAILIMILLFLGTSILSIKSIIQLQGNARIVNYAGIVRGGTQRLIKKEMAGYRDDELMSRIDFIIKELLEGGRINNLNELDSEVFKGNMMEVQRRWVDIVSEVHRARETEDCSRLYMLSESFFDLVDRTVGLAEADIENKISKSLNYIIFADVVFFLLLLYGLAGYVYSRALKLNAESLGQIAFEDALTQLPNRTSCEREITCMTNSPPDDDVAVFVFDMNDLKSANKKFGRRGGDKNILALGRILKEEGESFGFVGRYGGDEFIAIFRHGNEEMASSFLTNVNERVISYNLLYVDELEKINFSVGYCIGDVSQLGLHEMINEADHRMYDRKKETRENR